MGFREKSRNFFRRTGAFILVTLAALVSLSFIAHIPAVQAFGIQHIAAILSNVSGTRVEVGKFDFNFLNHLDLYDVYVETPGAANDTLIFSEAIEVRFYNLFSLIGRRLNIKEVALRNVELNFERPDSAEVSTLTSLLRNFKRDAPPDADIAADSLLVRTQSDTSDRSAFEISVNRLIGEDLQVRYFDDHKNTSQSYGLQRGVFEFDKVDIDAPLLRLSGVFLTGLDVAIHKHAEPDFEDLDSLDTESALRLEVASMKIEDSHFTLVNDAKPGVDAGAGVDYKDLDVSNITIDVSGFTMEDLDFAGRVNNIAFEEKSGFEVNGLSSDLASVTDTGIILEGLLLETPGSSIKDTLRFLYSEYSDFKDFDDRVYIDATIDNSKIAVRDLVLSVPGLRSSLFFQNNINADLLLSGRVRGRINRLRANDLKGRLGSLSFEGEFASRNLTVPNEQMLNLRVRRAVADAQSLRESFPDLKLTDQYDNLGTITFSGRFDGFFNDFVAYGQVESALGAASLDMRLNVMEGPEQAEYSGGISLDSFDLGGWTESPDLGKVSAALQVVNGRGLTAESANGVLRGSISSLEYKSYVYRDVVINGLLDENYFNGDLEIVDENISLSFSGSADLRGETPEFDFQTTIDSMDLLALNLVQDTFTVAGKLELAGAITKSKGMNGLARASSVHIYRGEDNDYVLDTIGIVSTPEDSIDHYTITSDYINGTIDGQFQVASFYPQLARHLQTNYPEVFQNIKYKQDSTVTTVDLKYDLVLSDPEDWSGLIGLDDLYFGSLGIKGNVNLPGDSISMTMSTPYISKGALGFRELYGGFELDDGYMTATLSSDTMFINDYGLDAVEFEVVGKGRDFDWGVGVADLFDSLMLDINGRFHHDTSGLFVIEIDKDSSTIFDAGWEVHLANRLAWKKEYIDIDSFSLTKGNRAVHLYDINNRGIHLDIDSFDIHYVDAIWDYEQLEFAGFYSLDATVTDIFALDEVHVNLDIPDLHINNDPYGLFKLNVDMESAGEPLMIDLEIGNAPNQVLMAKGYYNPAVKNDDQNLDVTVTLDTFPVRFLEYFLDENIVDTEGDLIGEVVISGDTSQVDMNGSAIIKGGATTVVVLGTRYKLDDQEVRLTRDFIDLTGAIIEDEEGNIASITGGLWHTLLKNMGLDVQINTLQMIGMDLPKSDGAVFYGKGIGSAEVNFQGPVKSPNLVVNATTTEGTRIFIPLDEGTSTSSESFLQFVERDSLGNVIIEREQKLITGLDLEMNLTITPGAQVDFIFNEQTRDIIRGRGSGDIQLNLNRAGDFTLYGGVEVESGDYLFTNFAVNKPFVIRPGGTLTWSGDPYDAQINIIADYEGVRASLSTLLEEYLINASPNAQQEARQPTNIQLELLLTGSLLEPQINFNIEFPDVTGELSGYLDSKMKTLEANQNALNEQVFGLMWAGTFLPSNVTRNTSGSSLAIVGATNTLTEFLSSQLSFFISDFISGAIEDVDFISGIDFDVGYNTAYDYYEQSSTYSEWEVHMRNRLFNDRIIVDVGGSYVTDNPVVAQGAYFAGDYALEYVLTEDRRLKVRFYHRNEETIEGRRNKTGIGLSYRREFDTFKEWLQGLDNEAKKAKKAAKESKGDPN